MPVSSWTQHKPKSLPWRLECPTRSPYASTLLANSSPAVVTISNTTSCRRTLRIISPARHLPTSEQTCGLAGEYRNKQSRQMVDFFEHQVARRSGGGGAVLKKGNFLTFVFGLCSSLPSRLLFYLQRCQRLHLKSGWKGYMEHTIKIWDTISVRTSVDILLSGVGVYAPHTGGATEATICVDARPIENPLRPLDVHTKLESEFDNDDKTILTIFSRVSATQSTICRLYFFSPFRDHFTSRKVSGGRLS